VFSSSFSFGYVFVLVIYLAVIALVLYGLYLVIRAAVRRALRDHQLWLDSRGGGAPGV
jgi:hypothetical protein